MSKMHWKSQYVLNRIKKEQKGYLNHPDYRGGYTYHNIPSATLFLYLPILVKKYGEVRIRRAGPKVTQIGLFIDL